MSEVFIIGSTKIQTTKQVKINFLLKNFNMSIKLIRKIFTLNIFIDMIIKLKFMLKLKIFFFLKRYKAVSIPFFFSKKIVNFNFFYKLTNNRIKEFIEFKIFQMISNPCFLLANYNKLKEENAIVNNISLKSLLFLSKRLYFLNYKGNKIPSFGNSNTQNTIVEKSIQILIKFFFNESFKFMMYRDNFKMVYNSNIDQFIHLKSDFLNRRNFFFEFKLKNYYFFFKKKLELNNYPIFNLLSICSDENKIYKNNFLNHLFFHIIFQRYFIMKNISYELYFVQHNEIVLKTKNSLENVLVIFDTLKMDLRLNIIPILFKYCFKGILFQKLNLLENTKTNIIKSNFFTRVILKTFANKGFLRLAKKGKNIKYVARRMNKWIFFSHDYKIIKNFNLITKLLIKYYFWLNNLFLLWKLFKRSLALTLAHKYKKRTAKYSLKKWGTNLTIYCNKKRKKISFIQFIK
jgi:hypothetical protein